MFRVFSSRKKNTIIYTPDLYCISWGRHTYSSYRNSKPSESGERTLEQLDAAFMKKIKRLHFVGIGGSGMFPIVQILHAAGYTITGSDVNEGDIINYERAMGIDVKIPHAAENV